MLQRPAYRKAPVLSCLIGIPVSLIAFWFLAGLHELEHLVWVTWPHHLGWADPPGGWPLTRAPVTGVSVALIVLWLPGGGGHIPAGGLHAAGALLAPLPGLGLVPAMAAGMTSPAPPRCGCRSAAWCWSSCCWTIPTRSRWSCSPPWWPS